MIRIWYRYHPISAYINFCCKIWYYCNETGNNNYYSALFVIPLFYPEVHQLIQSNPCSYRYDSVAYNLHMDTPPWSKIFTTVSWQCFGYVHNVLYFNFIRAFVVGRYCLFYENRIVHISREKLFFPSRKMKDTLYVKHGKEKKVRVVTWKRRMTSYTRMQIPLWRNVYIATSTYRYGMFFLFFIIRRYASDYGTCTRTRGSGAWWFSRIIRKSKPTCV